MLKDIVKDKQKIALITHIFPDGDALWSSFGIGKLLKNLGKEVDFWVPTPIDKNLRFVIADENYQVLEDINQLRWYDLIIAVDAGSPDMVFEKVGNNHQDLQIPILVIDHHFSNQWWGDYNLVNPNKGSNAQRVSELIIQEFGEDAIDEQMAQALLTGIYTDSWGFLRGLDQSSFEIAWILVKRWAQPTIITDNIFLNKYLKGYKFLADVVKRVKIEDKFLRTWFDDEDLARYDLQFEEAKWYLSDLIKVKDREFVIIFKKYEWMLKASIRAKDKASWLAQKLWWWGHKAAAGFKVLLDDEANRQQTMLQTIQKIKQILQS